MYPENFIEIRPSVFKLSVFKRLHFIDPEGQDRDPDESQNCIISSFYLFRHMDNIFEKISLSLILFKIFHIYLCHYFATNNIGHLIVKDKVAEQHILGKVL